MLYLKHKNANITIGKYINVNPHDTQVFANTFYDKETTQASINRYVH